MEKFVRFVVSLLIVFGLFLLGTGMGFDPVMYGIICVVGTLGICAANEVYGIKDGRPLKAINVLMDVLGTAVGTGAALLLSSFIG